MEYYLSIVLRWLHILSAAATVGGTLLISVALLPAAEELADDARRKLLEAFRARWAKIVHAAVGLLLLTGLLNFFMFSLKLFKRGTPESKLYNGLFGVKALLALAVFGLAEVLVGRSPLAEKLRANGKLWSKVNLALLVAIVCLSGVMRSMHTAPNKAAPAAVPANAAAP